MQSHIHSVGTSRGLFLEQVRLCQEPHLTGTAEPSSERRPRRWRSAGGRKKSLDSSTFFQGSNAGEGRGATMILQLMGN